MKKNQIDINLVLSNARKISILIALASTLSVGSVVLTGCGSGGGVPKETVTNTPLRLQIDWPTRSRVADLSAPGSALSVVLTLTRTGTGETVTTFPAINRQDGASAYSQVYASPTSVSPGNVNLTVRFYSQKDGQGTQVAFANKAFVLESTGSGAGVLTSAK